MAKFDPFRWVSIEPGKFADGPRGMLNLKCSDPQACVYIETDEAGEVLASVGQVCKLRVTGAYRFKVDCADGAKISVENPFTNTFKPDEEVFTNADRKPIESGSLYEVKKALRELEISKRGMLREMRDEARKLRTSPRNPKPADPVKPQAEPEDAADVSENVQDDDATAE